MTSYDDLSEAAVSVGSRRWKLLLERTRRAVLSLNGPILRESIIGHLQRLHLLTQRETWDGGIAGNPPAQLVALLRSPHLAQLVVADVERSGTALLGNPFLMHAIGRVEPDRLKRLPIGWETTEVNVITELMTLVTVIDRLCEYMGDWHRWQAISDLWHAHPPESTGDSFDTIKYRSVDLAAHRVRSALERKEVGPGFSHVLLPANIMEAAMLEMRERRLDNARAGLTLAANWGDRREHRRAGTGPTRIRDGVILVSPNLPKAWADLYVSWNACFVAASSEFPFTLAPLLVPRMADYAAEPRAFLFWRTLSLQVFMHYYAYAQQERHSLQVHWADRGLTKTWGSANRVAAASYQRSVVAAKRTPTTLAVQRLLS